MKPVKAANEGGAAATNELSAALAEKDKYRKAAQHWKADHDN